MAAKHEQQSESSDDDDEPSQEVIAQRAAAIRATWSERVERERRVWHGRVEWALPWIGEESVDVLQNDTAETSWCEKP